jgi:hypothetical protein
MNSPVKSQICRGRLRKDGLFFLRRRDTPGQKEAPTPLCGAGAK